MRKFSYDQFGAPINPCLCNFGISEAVGAFLLPYLTSAGIGAVTAGDIAGGVGSGVVGAGLGAGEAAITGGNIGQGAEFGGITGGLVGGLGPTIGSTLGIGTTAGDVLAGLGGGAVGAAATGQNIGTGALSGGLAGGVAGLTAGSGPSASGAPTSGAGGAAAAAPPAGVSVPTDPTVAAPASGGYSQLGSDFSAPGVENVTVTAQPGGGALAPNPGINPITAGAIGGGAAVNQGGGTSQSASSVLSQLSPVNVTPSPVTGGYSGAGTTPQAPNSLSQFFNNPSGSNALNVLTSNPGAALGAVGLGYDVLNQGKIPGEAAISAQATEQGNQAEALEAPLTGGNVRQYAGIAGFGASPGKCRHAGCQSSADTLSAGY